jgi:hypothetical protein
VTYVDGSAQMASTEPFTVSCAFSCDECHRMMVSTMQVDPPAEGPAYYHNPPVLRRQFLNAEKAGHEQDWEPKAVLGKRFPDVPSEIGAPASETFECFSIGAYRAAVLLARSVIEASAKAKGITTGSLYEKIDKLAASGHIRSMLADAAHEIRLAGNDMAHGDFATSAITREDAQELLEFMEDFLRETFELPTRVARRRDRRASAQAQS